MSGDLGGHANKTTRANYCAAVMLINDLNYWIKTTQNGNHTNKLLICEKREEYMTHTNVDVNIDKCRLKLRKCDVSIWTLFILFRISSRRAGCCEHGNKLYISVKATKFLDQTRNY
jgi:hypothetical protein